MAHFVRQRAAGLWVNDSVITQAELEAIDENLSKAINGDDGGTWSPTAPIIIGGSGLQVDGPLNAPGGNVTFDGAGLFSCAKDATFSGSTLNVNADTTTFTKGVYFSGTCVPQFQVPAYFLDDVTLGDSAADVINVLGTAQFAEAAQFLGGITVGSAPASFQGDVDLGNATSDTVNINGTSAVKAPMTLSGAGQLIRRAVIGADANTTYQPDAVDVIRINSLTADRVYTIGTSGVAEGSMMRIYSNNAAWKVTLQRSDLTFIADVKINAVGAYYWVDLLYINTRWELAGFDLKFV